MSPFSGSYKKLDNLSLLKIIDTPGDYQPGAIDAANEELAARQLTGDEITAVREKIAAQKQEQQAKSEKINSLKDKAKDALYRVADTMNPIQHEKPSTPKAILWLSLLMLLLFLYQLHAQFGLLRYMLMDNSAQWDFSMAMYFIRPLIFMPLGAILFAFRKRSGWALLLGYFIYLGMNTIVLFYMVYKHPAHPDNSIALLLPPTPVNSLIPWLIFNAGCIYFMLKADVREFYRINARNILTAIVAGILLSLTALL